ncbi:MAG: hypothetical protein ACTHK0_19200 [Ginsengibacter sp.]
MLKNFNFQNKARDIWILLLMTFSLLNLKCKNEVDKWSEINIDAKISLDSVYNQLNKENEIFSVFEPKDTLRKRSSDVSYFVAKKIDLMDNRYASFNNCRAYFFRSNTLSIEIGIGNGFGGNGFVIYYKDHKFCTKPYHFTDVIIEGEVEPTYKTVYQNLTLDKSNYKVGDSLYGRIEFKSIETDNYNKKTEHFAIGNFRAKVEK